MALLKIGLKLLIIFTLNSCVTIRHKILHAIDLKNRECIVLCINPKTSKKSKDYKCDRQYKDLDIDRDYFDISSKKKGKTFKKYMGFKSGAYGIWTCDRVHGFSV